MEAFEASEKNGFIKFWGLGQFYTVRSDDCNFPLQRYKETLRRGSFGCHFWLYVACNNCRTI